MPTVNEVTWRTWVTVTHLLAASRRWISTNADASEIANVANVRHQDIILASAILRTGDASCAHASLHGKCRLIYSYTSSQHPVTTVPKTPF